MTGIRPLARGQYGYTPGCTRTQAAAKAVRIESELARRGGLGLHRVGTELIGPCPRCGGRDRFAVSIPKQLFHCRACNVGGDVISMIRHIDGCDFRTAVGTLAGFEQSRGLEAQPPKTDHRPIDLVNQSEIDSSNTKWALQLWNDALPIGGTLAERYLHRRGLLDLPGDHVLRFHPTCSFGKSRQACLLALYRDIHTNEPVAIARTALGAAGNKISRMSLGPTKNAAVKIDDDADVEHGLTVGEGFETCIAARQLGFRPAWALGSAGAIRSFPVLAGIDALTVLADHDIADQRGRRAGQEAAWECVKRWRAADRDVNVVLPKAAGRDMADYFAGAAE